MKDEKLAPIIGDAAPRTCRVYFTFSLLAEQYFQRVAEIRDGEFAQHVQGRRMTFEFVGVPRGIVPPGAPSRIWQKGIDDEQRGILD